VPGRAGDDVLVWFVIQAGAIVGGVCEALLCA
jgi:hypothetical protein